MVTLIPFLLLPIIGVAAINLPERGPSSTLTVTTVMAIVGWAILIIDDDRWSILTFALLGLCFSVERGFGVVLALAVSAIWTAAWIDDGVEGWQLLIPLAVFGAGVILWSTLRRAEIESATLAGLVERLESTQADLAAAERERGVLAERARFAGEIHDTLAQGFTSIVVLGRAAQRTGDVSGALTEIESVAEDHLAAARRLVAAIGPADLESLSLPDAMRRQLDRTIDPATMQAHFEVIGDTARLPAEVEVTLFRGLQETLLNVRKHAAAAQRPRHPQLSRRRRGTRRSRRRAGFRRRSPRRPRQPHRGARTASAPTSNPGPRRRVDGREHLHGRHSRLAPIASGGAVITLLIVDDHPIVRSGLATLLGAEDDIEIVGEAGNGGDAVAAALALRPSATLMDLRMPDVDGVEATARIKSEWPDAAIVVLTTYDTDEAIVRAIEAGASGYLLKDAPPETLLDAIRRAAAGETVLAPPVARRLIERVRDPAAGALSRREIEVLREVASGNTNAQIADQLHISQATVKTHLLHIYDKLGVADRAAAVAHAYDSNILTPRNR